MYLALGLAETLVVGLADGPVLGRRDGATAVILVLALLPLAAAIVYSASRSEAPPHSRHVNAVLLGLAAALLSVTLTVGHATFPDSYPWWISGATLSGLAVAFCGVFEFRHLSARDVTRR